MDTFGPMAAEVLFDAPWQKDVFGVLVGGQQDESWTLEALNERISQDHSTKT